MPEFNPERPLWSNSLIRVRFITRYQTMVERYQCSLYYRPSSITTICTPTTLSEFNANWRVNCLASLQGCFTDAVRIAAIKVDDIYNPALLENEETLTANGTGSGETMPPFVQTTFRLQTNFRGKKGRGRIQLPVVPEAFHEQGLLSAAGLAAYAAFRDDIMLTVPTDSPSDDWSLCVARRQTLQGDGTYTTRVALVQEINIREDAGSQDRRKFGRGS